MRKKIFTILLALVASVGLMNAKVTWNRSNISDLDVHGTYESYSKEGVTLSTNANEIAARWYDFGDESHSGIMFNAFETGGFTFSNTLDKKFTKIEMTLIGPAGWDNANLGNGWSFSFEYVEEPVSVVTWTGNASKVVDLVKDESHFYGDYVKSIVFYFEGDSEEPDPTYTVALEAGTANANKVTLSKTSAVEGATITVTPDDEYEITAFSATYNTTEEAPSTLDPATGAYSFTMPAADVTIEATIALKPVPEGDIFAGFTATAGAGGFNNEGSANLVDNKFTSGNEQTDWTKWCANDGHKSVPTGESESCWWIDFEADAAISLTGYILTTGNDTGNEHGRNPKNWVLKAKLNADDAWTTIANVTNDVTMKNKSFKDYKFFVDQSGPFQYFRFEVFANQGAGVMQLCELRLIGAEPAAPAAPTVYNSGSVALSNLKVGDILMAGVTVTSEKADYKITLAANRLKFMNSVRSTDLTTQFSSINPVLGENAVIHTSNTAMFYTPIDEDGNIGNAWEVTANEVGTKVTLAGITYSGTTPASSDEETTTVTWNSTDFTEEGTYTSHKGIEVNPGVEVIDIAMEVPIVSISPYGTGSFSTTNSNLVFTKIEVSGGVYDEPSFEGEGWSDSEGKRVWEGQAATVPFNLGFIYSGDEGDVPWTIVFTLAPAAPAEDVDITPNVDPENPTVYYSTFYDSANKYALPAGVEAYIVTTVSGDVMQLQKVADAGQTIPAGAGVILKATVNGFTLTPSDADAVSVEGNRLEGSDVSIATPANCYVLSCKSNLVGFYHYAGSMLNPHKAYIVYSSSNQAPHRLRFAFDQATGVENVQGDQVQSTKVIENGVLYIIKNGVKYNAMGQEVK